MSQTTKFDSSRTIVAADYYDGVTIFFHWIIAAFVVLTWTLGQCIDYFTKGAPRTAARSVHILIGATLVLLLVGRLAWRIGWGRRLPPAGDGAIARTATYTHVVLYMLLGTTLALGVANAWIRGDTITGLFKIPSLAPGDEVLKALVEDWHGTAANLALAVAGLHAIAGLYHHFRLRDGVLRRMLPNRDRR